MKLRYTLLGLAISLAAIVAVINIAGERPVLAAPTGGASPPSSSASPASGSATHPNVLTNASEQQVATLALARVGMDFAILSGSPLVALARKTSLADMSALKLPLVPMPTIEQPPLMLVIVRGSFGASHLPGFQSNATVETYTHIAYVYDLWAGKPMVTWASPHGGEFRTALNDPSLPVVPAPVGPDAVKLGRTPGPLLHYGDTLPPATAPQVHR